MIFEAKRPSELTEGDLGLLIHSAIPEGKDVEFKDRLPGSSDSEKKEFLADVTAFANTIGGWLLYGVVESEGVATSLPGCAVDDPDAEKLRLENLIRMGVEPRLPDCSLATVRLQDGRHIVAIKLRRSFAYPHRVILGGHAQFYARNSAGKYPMDVSELRTAFTRGQSLAERVKEFRRGRLVAIEVGETPLPLRRDPLFALHILPLRAFETSDVADMELVWEQREAFQPILGASMGARMTALGLLTHSASTTESANVLAYSQLYRSGIIEAVSVELLGSTSDDGEASFSGTEVEKWVIRATEGYLQVLRKIGIDAPHYITLSFLDVRGRKLWTRNPVAQKNAKPILENELLPPEILCDDVDTPVASMLRPALESLWHSGGMLGSPSYDKKGTWLPQRDW